MSSKKEGFAKTVGSRAEVFHGTAFHTKGGLKKSDLKKNDRGEIVSKHKSNKTKWGPGNPLFDYLKEHNQLPKRGSFKLVKKSRRSKK
jgi:hypothetical protein